MDNNGTPTAWAETKAGQNLQKRLTNENTLNSLDGVSSGVGWVASELFPIIESTFSDIKLCPWTIPTV